jgi:excisionase family DNA binding protein
MYDDDDLAAGLSRLDEHDDYVSVSECAQRLGLSEKRVRELVTARVLRAYADGYGQTMVQPALIQGYTT